MTQCDATVSTPVSLRPFATPVPDVPSLGEWHGQGLCIGEDPGIFFPAHGDPGRQARKICARCGVRDDCLNYATEADEFGIWGGLDQRERRNLRRRRHRSEAAARDQADHPGDAA